MMDTAALPLVPHACSLCGGAFDLVVWIGRCPDCHGINSLRPVAPTIPSPLVAVPLGASPPVIDPAPTFAPRRRHPPPPPRRKGPAVTIPDEDPPEDLSDCPDERIPRNPTGHTAFDGQFKGGFPDGGFPTSGAIMLAGMPGAGKSRMTLELLARLASRGFRCTVVSGEEQKAQIGARSREMRLPERFPWTKGNLQIFLTNGFERLLAHLALGWDYALVDAMNVFYAAGVGGAQASVRQLTHMGKKLHECSWASKNTEFEHQKAFGLLAICHATKEGDMGGPQAAKHLFDAAYMLDHTDEWGTPLADQTRYKMQPDGSRIVRLGSIAKNRFAAPHGDAYCRLTPEPEGIVEPYTPPPRAQDPA